MKIQQFKLHLECCQRISNLGLEMGLTRVCTEDEILDGCDELQRLDLVHFTTRLNLSLQKTMLEDTKLRTITHELLIRDIATDRLMHFLEEMPIDRMIVYSIEELCAVLKNLDIDPCNIDWYLRYYKSKKLTSDQLDKIKIGFYNLNRFCPSKVEAEAFLEQYPKFAYSGVMASSLFDEMGDKYLECIYSVAKNLQLYQILKQVCEAYNVDIPYDTFSQIRANSTEILELLKYDIQFFDKEYYQQFYRLWIDFGATVQDLRNLKRRIDEGKSMRVHECLHSKVAYVSFLYGDGFDLNSISESKQDLLIYAITHKKKSFLKLVRENKNLFDELPSNSILFVEIVYKYILNINTLNKKDLGDCAKLYSWNSNTLEALNRTNLTFAELKLLMKLPVEYADLFKELYDLRIDDRIRIMREVIKHKCLHKNTNITTLAKKLKLHPLSVWMQHEFGHIHALEPSIAVALIERFDEIEHLVPGIKTNYEARYVAGNVDAVSQCSDMNEVRNNVLATDKEWLELSEVLCLDPNFVQENIERVREFVFKDGAHIMLRYYYSVPDKQKELHRLVIAELLGRFRELKYHADDLNKEIGYPITENVKVTWMENLNVKNEYFYISEEDKLLPVMQMGEVPFKTCIYYDSGAYCYCLLSNHDSNKKIVNVYLNGRVTIRIAIRLTKGMFGKFNIKEPKLEFADLLNETQENLESTSREHLVLFMERCYAKGISGKMLKNAQKEIFHLMLKKAKALGAVLVLCRDYDLCEFEGVVLSDFSVYISRSKAGMQYLDSIGGANSISDEGKYYNGKFLVYVGSDKNE